LELSKKVEMNPPIKKKHHSKQIPQRKIALTMAMKALSLSLFSAIPKNLKSQF